MKLLLLPTAHTAHGEMVEVPIEALMDTAHKYREQKDGPAYVGAVLRDGYRDEEHVEGVTAITLDFDGKIIKDGFVTYNDIKPETILPLLSKWTYVAWSTHSHMVSMPGKHGPINKWRVMLPLAHPIGVVAFKRLLHWMMQLTGGVADSTCVDPCRLFYLPSCHEKMKAYAWVKSNQAELIPMAVIPPTFSWEAPTVHVVAKKTEDAPAVAGQYGQRWRGLGGLLLETFWELPATKWAMTNPDALSREVWRGFASTLCALVTEDEAILPLARQAFHRLSNGYTGYSPEQTDKQFDEERKYLQEGHMITLKHMVLHGLPKQYTPEWITLNYEVDLLAYDKLKEEEKSLAKPVVWGDPPAWEQKWTTRTYRAKGWK